MMNEDPGYMDNLIDGADQNQNDTVDIEMALLSLCMRKDKAMLEAVENKLVKEDFTDPRNELIYGIIIDMFLNNASIDRFTVTNELERRGELERAGGLRYIYKVGETTAVTSNIKEYIAAIREKSDKNKLITELDKVRGMAISGEKKTTEVVDYAISSISMLKSTGETKGFEALSEILKTTMKEMSEELKPGHDSKQVKLGFPRLDEMLSGGLKPGSLNILAARPSMGKSALAINMAANVAASNKPVAIFSLEMSKQEIAKRFMSASMNKPLTKILYSHKMTNDDKREIDNAVVKLSDYPVFIDDNSDTNPATMKSKLTELRSKPETTPALVIVDYLQLMNMPGYGKRSRNEEVTAISRSLKILAKEFEVPIIALSQLSRGAAQRDDHTPQLSDLRDSGAIEQDADTVMFIDRPDYYKKNDDAAPKNGDGDGNEAPKPQETDNDNVVKDAYIYLSKNRQGRTGRDKVCWIARKTLFYEYDKNRPDPDDGGSAYTRTQSSDSSAASYEFEPDEPETPKSENESYEPDDALFANAHDEFADGFLE